MQSSPATVVLAVTLSVLLATAGCSRPTPPAAAQALAPRAAGPVDTDRLVGAVFLGGTDLHTCAGSVLHSGAGDLILTAAHCLGGGYDAGPGSTARRVRRARGRSTRSTGSALGRQTGSASRLRDRPGQPRRRRAGRGARQYRPVARHLPQGGDGCDHHRLRTRRRRRSGAAAPPQSRPAGSRCGNVRASWTGPVVHPGAAAQPWSA
jgi:hypothetical protein